MAMIIDGEGYSIFSDIFDTNTGDSVHNGVISPGGNNIFATTSFERSR